MSKLSLLVAASMYELNVSQRRLGLRCQQRHPSYQLWGSNDLAAKGYQLLVTGMGANRATRAVRTFLNDTQGSTHFGQAVLFGVSGALRGDLKVGEVCYPHWVASGEKGAQRIELSRDCMLLGRNHNMKANDCGLVSVHRLVCSADEKLRLGESSHADIVDLETHSIVLEFHGADIPCGVVRAVSDDAQTSLPEAMAHFVHDDQASLGAQVLRSVQAVVGSGFAELAHMRKRVNLCSANLDAVLRSMPKGFLS